jgi:hypothetical protein
MVRSVDRGQDTTNVGQIPPNRTGTSPESVDNVKIRNHSECDIMAIEKSRQINGMEYFLSTILTMLQNILKKNLNLHATYCLRED